MAPAVGQWVDDDQGVPSDHEVPRVEVEVPIRKEGISEGLEVIAQTLRKDTAVLLPDLRAALARCGGRVEGLESSALGLPIERL